MRHTIPLVPQFYVTTPQPCPYLKGRLERKLFTSLQGANSELLNDSLSKQGFRRSQNVLYRPACSECSACLSARICVDGFKFTKNQKRVLSKNSNLYRQSNAPWATEEQFDLFRKYLDTRHSDGGMADMDVFEFAAMLEETSVRSRVIEYKNDMEDLIAVALTDVLEDGVSMVYSFFEPENSKLSLGTYLILDHIRIAQDAGLPYVYLGYWVPGSEKMAYKARFKGLEIYYQGRWQKMDYESDYCDVTNPEVVKPIAAQVSEINLPDTLPTKR